MQILISILAYVAAIGILVTAHEFGHFIVARTLGIKVLRFSIGFGKPLYIWRRRNDETEYVLSALPLGGYVKMADEREGEVAERDLPRAFNRQRLPKRFAVVLAGPVFNLLFAVLAYWVIYMVGIPGLKPMVGEVAPKSAAAAAGFQPQDEIVSVAGSSVVTWDGAQLALFQAVLHGGPIQLTVQRGTGKQQLTLRPGPTRELTEPGQLLSGLGLTEYLPPIPAVAGKLTEDGSAAASGVQAGDRFVAIAGQAVVGWQDLVRIVRASPGKTLPAVVERDGRQLPLDLRIASVSEKGAPAIGQIGVQVQPPASDFYDKFSAEQRYNPPVALWQAFTQTAGLAWLTLDASWNMLTGNVSVKNLSGPIDIAQYAGYSAESGLVPFLAFLAIVSISLGVLNLLPIPVLDGGHLLYFVAEAVRGSPLSEQVEMLGQRVGIVLLVVLMGFAVCNDLIRVLS